MSDRTPFYLDCDTGIDDALALVQLLSNPGVDLVGIGAVSGNVDAATAAANTRAVLGLAGRADIPVAVGTQDPLAHPFDGGARHVHGDNGLGGVELPVPDAAPVDGSAAELLVRLARANPGSLRVVAIGPLTNLAIALALDPDLPSLVADVTIMGGAVWDRGNRTEFAEANIASDPEAAAIVLAADWRVTLVPLDVTRGHWFDEADQGALLEAASPVAQALGRMLTRYIDFYETVLGVRKSLLHDPLASAIATGDIVPSAVRWTALGVDTSDGPERGRTRPVAAGAQVRVVTEAPAASARILRDLLVAYRP